jgi:hypothetical protein
MPAKKGQARGGKTTAARGGKPATGGRKKRARSATEDEGSGQEPTTKAPVTPMPKKTKRTTTLKSADTNSPESTTEPPVNSPAPSIPTAAETTDKPIQATPVALVENTQPFPRNPPQYAALAAVPNEEISADYFFNPNQGTSDLFLHRLPKFKNGIFADNQREQWFSPREEFEIITAPEYITSGTKFEKALAEAKEKPNTYPEKIMHLTRPKTRESEANMREYLSFENTKLFRTWVRTDSKYQSTFPPTNSSGYREVSGHGHLI